MLYEVITPTGEMVGFLGAIPRPIKISLEIPDFEQNRELMNLIVPEIFGIKRESYSSTWDYYNKYVAKNYTEYLNEDRNNFV